MAIVNVIMPKLGESIMEATVLKWHKKVGDFVKLDEPLLDIATDKVDSEVPSTAEGILEELCCKENDVIAIGSIIAKIKTSATETIQSNPLPIASNGKENGLSNGAVHSTQNESNGQYVPYQPSTDRKSVV